MWEKTLVQKLHMRLDLKEGKPSTALLEGYCATQTANEWKLMETLTEAKWLTSRWWASSARMTVITSFRLASFGNLQ